MTFWRTIRRKLREAVAPAIFLALTGYFAWSATQGDLGLKSYARELAVLREAKAAQADAQQDQVAWTQRVRGLRDNALDADIIDERARAMLNLATGSEIVIPYEQGQKLF